MFLESLCLPRACFWTPLSSAGMFLHVLCLPRACLWTAFTLSSTMGLFLDPFFGLLGGPFWGSILVPVVRFGAPFWCRWCVLGFPFEWLSWHHPPDSANTMPKSLKRPPHERAAGPHFRGSVLVPVVRFGAPFWCRCSVLGLRFVRFWGSVLVPVVRFGARFWFRWSVFGARFRWSVLGLHFGAGAPFWGFGSVWSVFGARFWCRWSVLGLGFGSGGPFWGSILVPVLRFGASFWCRCSVLGLRFSVVRFWGSVLVPVVCFGARFWFWWSVLGLHFGAGGPFWGFGLVPVARSVLVLVVRFGASFWFRWSVLFGSVPVVRFWGSVLVPVVRFGARFWFRWSVFGARFWFRWSVLGLHFGAGAPFWGFGSVPVVRFWGSVLVPVVCFGARFWFRWSVLGLHFGAGGPFWGAGGSFLGLGFGSGGSFWGFGLVPVVRFWGSALVPVVRFGASFWFRWSVLGLRFGAGGSFLGFWCRWSVLGLGFGSGGPFWGSILVPVVRFEAPFWCLVVRYSGARFWCVRCVLVVHFGDRFWCRWSVLGLHFPGPRFWTSSGFGGLRFWTSSGFRGLGFGPPLVLDLLWLPGARFWTSVGFPVLVFGPPLASGARFWTSSCGFVLGPSRPTISESPYICFKSSSHPLFASLAFVFPFAPPSICGISSHHILILWSTSPWGAPGNGMAAEFASEELRATWLHVAPWDGGRLNFKTKKSQSLRKDQWIPVSVSPKFSASSPCHKDMFLFVPGFYLKSWGEWWDYDSCCQLGAKFFQNAASCVRLNIRGPYSTLFNPASGIPKLINLKGKLEGPEPNLETSPSCQWNIWKIYCNLFCPENKTGEQWILRLQVCKATCKASKRSQSL